ncbi:MAG: preprotein translocase subunit SecE [Clostridia bacterium]|nr:preprotein translocase subunit SecE [Oscillospiraceae bacterium]MBR4892357.1 preprotein translocase subunit SecE [Clostridia bacterium]
MMNKAGTNKKENKLVKSIRGIKSEFKKIVWPSWKQLVNNTLIVIAFVLIFGIIIALLDTGFRFSIVQWFTK